MDTSGLRATANFNIIWYFFASLFLSLAFAILLLIYLSFDHSLPIKNPNFKLYAALPTNNLITSDEVTSQDARSLIIKNFFGGYNSPLAALSDEFITEADKNQLDFRLLPAIAMQESIGGKRVIEGSYNPFGFGIYGSKAVHFESWEEAISVVAQSLREDYLNQGLTTPYEIMTKYTPPSLEKGGPWARGVTQFMEELK